MTRWRLAILATLSVLALSGCLRFTADLTLSQDNTVTGTFVVAVKKGTGEHYGTTDRSMSEEIWADYPAAKTLARPAIRDYSKDGYVGISIAFKDEPLASFAPTTDGWGIARVGDDFVVSGPSGASSAASTGDGTTGDGTLNGDTSQLQDAELIVTITFPGDVASTNGDATGRTVTWDLHDGPATLEARGSAIATQDPAVSMAYVMAGVIGLGAAAYALAGPIARRRR